MVSPDTTGSRQAIKGRILIVEDEEGMRELLKVILQANYCVSEADSGASLHKAMNHEQPDVVLLDMRLPDANGLGLLPVIKQRWPETEVIVLTGQLHDSGGASWATEAVNRGAFSLIPKSPGLNFQKLLDGIGLAVARRQQAEGEHSLRLCR